MVNLLAAGCIAIHDQSVTVVGDSFLSREFRCGQVHFSHQLCMLGLQIVDGTDMGFGDDQDMRWGLGCNIPESQQVIRLVDDIGGNLAIDDFEKQIVRHDALSFFQSDNPVSDTCIEVRKNRVADTVWRHKMNP